MSEILNIIGGGKDEHGCLVAAGYSWCNSKNKCLRVFEESCDDQIIELVARVSQKTGVRFIRQGKRKFDWAYVDKDGKRRQILVNGIEFAASGIDGTLSQSVNEYFKTNLKSDPNNNIRMRFGTVQGFWFAYNVCLLSIEEDRRIVDSEDVENKVRQNRNIKILCGFLNKNSL